MLIVVLAIKIYILSPVIFLGVGMSTQPNPPKPEITYGEFPFRLEYEINGEHCVVEDTIICEFDGIGAGSNGKYRKWKERLASGNEGVLLYNVSATEKLFFITASPEFYMGDQKEGVEYNNHMIRAFIRGGASSGLIQAEELINKYGIKIITWEPSEPIQNTFK